MSSQQKHEILSQSLTNKNECLLLVCTTALSLSQTAEFCLKIQEARIQNSTKAELMDIPAEK